MDVEGVGCTSGCACGWEVLRLDVDVVGELTMVESDNLTMFGDAGEEVGIVPAAAAAATAAAAAAASRAFSLSALLVRVLMEGSIWAGDGEVLPELFPLLVMELAGEAGRGVALVELLGLGRRSMVDMDRPGSEGRSWRRLGGGTLLLLLETGVGLLLGSVEEALPSRRTSEVRRHMLSLKSGQEVQVSSSTSTCVGGKVG